MKRRIVIPVAGVAVLLLLVWSAGRPGRAPAVQPSLVTLTAENFSQFQQAFNAAPDSVRVVLLLSPT
jgi:hypothetical protein